MKIKKSILNFGKNSASRLLPQISEKDNKASRGRSLLFAGSEAYPGAGVLAARAALRMGSGYVVLAQWGRFVSYLENPDFLICDLTKSQWESLKFDSVLIGPGFGVNKQTAEIIQRLKELRFKNVILDADALTVCGQYNLFPLLPTWIATPHTGELGRCLGVDSQDVDLHREKYILQAQTLMNCIVLLKGHQTLVRSSSQTYRILSGNSSLAKSGTGDVLAGIITALRAQQLSPLKAALLGAYLHGACANVWVNQKKDPLSMMASDVIEILPKVVWHIRNSKKG